MIIEKYAKGEYKMYNYEVEVTNDIWEYLYKEFDGADLSYLSPEYLMNTVNLNEDSITGINSGSYWWNSIQAKDHVLNAMYELDDIVNDRYITDEQLGYLLRKEMYGDIDCIIRLRYATMLMPLIAVDYIENRKEEQNNEKEHD